MAVEVVRRRFSVEEYHRMAEARIFTEDDRVELIDGEVVQRTPIGSRHAGCVKRLNRLLTSTAGNRAIVSIRDPLALPPDSEPQPDLALLRPRLDFYAGSHPGPEDVWLVVEVADTSAPFDRTVKIPLYARAGIPEAWVVDLTVQAVEVYRRPSPEGYGESQRLTRGGHLACEAFPGLSVPVDEVLG